jgi:hypothetical protein
MQAVFLHHEGFLGALGALTSYEKLEPNNVTSSEESAEQVRPSLSSGREYIYREREGEREILIDGVFSFKTKRNYTSYAGQFT